ncbi:unnamed protein product [Rotaria magnacalcarata]|uniref:MATH domain-containing protein n=1 Tax=Rotaria magnacalcarata TaxID=392030 RepID=A0A816YUH3_9BILA|nr:unnamed protein product [Rotaria magnacalcarata]
MRDKGFKNDMKTLPIICSFCPWNDLFKDYEEHLKIKHPNPICEFCEERFNSTIKLAEHKQKECTKITVPCPLKEFGCSEPVCRAQLPEHYLIENHQKAIIKAIRILEAKVLNESHERVLGMDVDNGQSACSTMMTTTSENISSQMQEIYETINILAGGIQTLNDDTQRLSSESIKLQSSIESLTQDIGSLKLSVQEQSSFLDGIKRRQEFLEEEIASLKQKIDDLQYVSYDATLIWKIVSFNEKMMDAQSERQTSIYSPPFYSSPTGYKMRARLYLNGDGNARRTHMSLFFVLMRGRYDAILSWPFNYKVTFCLHDQSPQQKHVINSFRPDIRSSNFQRPRLEMNIASGIPKFFSLAMIQQADNPYVRDDTMFIKVMVDFSNVFDTLLPYVSGRNPGLPMHIEQPLLTQETPIPTSNPFEAETVESLISLTSSCNVANMNDESQHPNHHFCKL